MAMETSTAAPAPAAAAPSSAPSAPPATAAAPATAEPKPLFGSADPAEKPVEPAKSEAKSDAAPVYDLKVKDGSGLTPADIEGIKAFATANKLTPEAAQAVLDRDATRAGEQAKVNAQARIDAVRTWNDQNAANPKIGPADGPIIQRAQKFMASTAPPELLAQLHRTGLGSFPPFVEWVVGLSAGTGESTLAATGAPPSKAKTPREEAFPNSPGMDRGERS